MNQKIIIYIFLILDAIAEVPETIQERQEWDTQEQSKNATKVRHQRSKGVHKVFSFHDDICRR